jgi:putative ATPase
MNLFQDASRDEAAPLAARMRPTALDEIVGQEQLTAPGSVFRKALDQDRLPSLILHGPAGTGKSTLARVVAHQTRHRFQELSAVSAGVKDIREVARQAADDLALHGRRTLLFIDELHRLNKGQQDQLLPHVESGTFTLIGATTENPYFSVITPLLSRCRLFAVEKLGPEGLRRVVERALADRERGLGALPAALDEDAMAHLVDGAGGDARAALNALELAVLTAQPGPDGIRRVTVADAEAALQRPVLKYDRAGDEHYDTISAFIKSMRGSDPDAAIYWLAKMLEAGEDARFIARRIVIQAAEDVGLADPTALRVAIAAADAVEYIGLPEAQIPLAMAAIHVATAPKSNSACKAIAAAREDVRREGAAGVPAHLAGGMRPGDKRSEYLYPHDHPGGWVRQSYLPPELGERHYYQPGDNAREAKIAAWLAHLRQGQAGTAAQAGPPGAQRPARAEGDGLEDRHGDD